MHKHISVYKGLHNLSKVFPRLLHCEPYKLTHFSLHLNVAVGVENGNMQVRWSPGHQILSPAARGRQCRWQNTSEQGCTDIWAGTLQGWTGSSRAETAIWPQGPWAQTCKVGWQAVRWRRSSSPLDRRRAAALPSPPSACGTRAAGLPWMRGGSLRGTGARGSGSPWESPPGGGAARSEECCEGMPL